MFGKIGKILRGGSYETPTSFEKDTKTLKFVNKSPNEDPNYATYGDSGFDLRAWIQEDEKGVELNDDGIPTIKLASRETRLFHTGLYFQLPENTEIQVRTRSGNALKLQLVVTNSPGTVDEFYTNEVGVIVTNLSRKVITVTNGDRIAQGVLCPVYNSPLVNLTKVDQIEENEYRNKGGFGHTGIK